MDDFCGPVACGMPELATLTHPKRGFHMKRLFVAFGLLLLAAPVLTAPAQAQDFIAIRQAGQDLMAGTFGGLRIAVTAKTDVKTLLPAAKIGRASCRERVEILA